jgi:hypothetical protein
MGIMEHERVVLKTPIPSEGLQPGDVGAVVHVYADGQAYEVEFTSLDGHTAAVVTLEADQAPLFQGGTSPTLERCLPDNRVRFRRISKSFT